MKISILKTAPQTGYELLDSGDGEKLERFGEYILRRPDPQALWKKNLSEDKWLLADTEFSRKENDNGSGVWKKKKEIPASWKIDFGGLSLSISPTPFKHTGLFPEQLANWTWTKDIITNYELGITNKGQLQVLNLFGYTGGATLACAKAGAKVTHVDASKSAISWARENAENSGLTDAPIRWLLDDAMEFVRKEIKRGKKYDGIIMDPPAFGHGPNGEIWKIENSFLSLLDDVKKILTEKPLFVLVNGYASGYSSIAYENNLKDLVETYGGSIESGELAIEEKDSGRLLPAGIFSRWSK